MNVINRSEAKRQGLKQYFTGDPCKNGHTTYRYTQSGTCAACLRSANAPIFDSSRPARNHALAQMVQAKFRLFRDDVEFFESTAYAFALMRFPVLLKVDVYPGLLPLDSDPYQGLYKFNCHVDDLEPLRELAKSLIASRMPTSQDARQKARAQFIALGGDPDAP